MFLALRDLRFARGRFSLIVAVVALMTLLVGFLTGLTGGLSMQNISALTRLDAPSVVFSMPDGGSPSFSTSTLTKEQEERWAQADGIRSVTPLGISSAALESGTGQSASSEAVVLMAAPPGSPTDAPDAGITLGRSTADALGVRPGDTVALAGTDLTVHEVIDDQHYSHRTVAWTTLDEWHALQAATRAPDTYATVLLVDGAPADTAALDASAGTTSTSLLQSLLALDAFRSEFGSLALMIGMLVLIATLVIGVFFLVWSMQRQRDIAVLKALGATTGALARDAVAQALIVLVAGTGIGVLATLGLGVLAAQALPFALNAVLLLGPAVAMIAAGLLGALVSVRLITRVEPTLALQAAAA
ncbi:MAG: ABC transporter permease [Dermabacter sp.]|nr:ABC transporter permease [Dermabacter sp.]